MPWLLSCIFLGEFKRLEPHLLGMAKYPSRVVFQNDYVFNSDTAPAWYVNSGLNREWHSVF